MDNLDALLLTLLFGVSAIVSIAPSRIKAFRKYSERVENYDKIETYIVPQDIPKNKDFRTLKLRRPIQNKVQEYCPDDIHPEDYWAQTKVLSGKTGLKTNFSSGDTVKFPVYE